MNSEESSATVASTDESDESKSSSTELKMPRLVALGAAALAVAALIVAAVFGVLALVASNSADSARADERDTVLRVGASALKAVTELDYTKPDEFFDNSIKVSTKDLGEQISAGREERKKLLIEKKTITTATVLDIAVDELNTDEGKSSLLAAMRVEVKQGDKTMEKQIRMEIQLTKLSDGDKTWKLSGIDPVPVVS